MSRMRMATFSLAGLEADEEVEEAWNAWVDELAEAGYRPAEEPIRWTSTSATYRVFSIAVERSVRLFADLHVSRLVPALVAASLVAATTFNRWQVILDLHGVLPA